MNTQKFNVIVLEANQISFINVISFNVVMIDF